MNSPRSLLDRRPRRVLCSICRWMLGVWLLVFCSVGVEAQVHLEKTAAGCRFHFPAYKGFDYVIGTSTDLKVWSEETPVEGGGVPMVKEKVVSHRAFFVRVKTVPQHVVFADEVAIDGSAARNMAVSGDGRFSMIECEEPGGTAVVFGDKVDGKAFLLRRNALGYPVALELDDGTRFVFSAHSPGAKTVTLEIFNAAGTRVEGPMLLTNVPLTFFGQAPGALEAPLFSEKAASSAGREIWWVTDTTISVTSAASDLAHLKIGQGTVGAAAFVAGVAAKAATGATYEREIQDLAYGLSGASCLYGAGALLLAPPTGGITLPAAGLAAVNCAGFVVETVERVAKTYFPSDQERLTEINALAGEANAAIAAADKSYVFTPGGVFGTYTNRFAEFSAKIYEAKSKLASIKSVVSGFSNKEMVTNGSPSRYAQALEVEETVRDMIMVRLDDEKMQVEQQISNLGMIKAQAESAILLIQSALASPDLDSASRASLQQSLATMESLKSETQAGLEMMNIILPKVVAMRNEIF